MKNIKSILSLAIFLLAFSANQQIYSMEDSLKDNNEIIQNKCKYFNGYPNSCRYGNNCNYSHDESFQKDILRSSKITRRKETPEEYRKRHKEKEYNEKWCYTRKYIDKYLLPCIGVMSVSLFTAAIKNPESTWKFVSFTYQYFLNATQSS